MNSIYYNGYTIREDKDKWCVNLGIKIGIKCFDLLDDAKKAVDKRIQEIKEETQGG